MKSECKRSFQYAGSASSPLGTRSRAHSRKASGAKCVNKWLISIFRSFRQFWALWDRLHSIASPELVFSVEQLSRECHTNLCVIEGLKCRKIDISARELQRPICESHRLLSWKIKKLLR